MRVFFDTNVLISAYTARGLSADLFRLVLSEHEVLTGESPFPDTRIPRRFNQPVRPLPSYVPHLLAVIIARCMEPDPSQRPSAAEIEQSLLSFFKDY